MTPSPIPSRERAERPPTRRPSDRARTEAYYASRTLQALELLSFQPLSCPQLAATMQIHPRTARRLLLRLAADGYIEQTLDSRRRYRITLRLAALGCQVVAHAELPRIAAPFVADLHASSGAAAHLVIPSYRAAACIVHCDHPHHDQPHEPMLRELLPAHATAAGKVLLAYRQRWRDSLLRAALRQHTDRTVTSPADIESAAAQTRTRGYAIDDGESRAGTLAIAAPVFVHGQVPAALAVSIVQGDRARHNLDALTERVVTTAAALTRALHPHEIAT